MWLKHLDHVNIRTVNIDAMTAFYCDILGMKTGERPPFNFGGAWLYCGERAAVHLVEVAKPLAFREIQIEHFAFAAEGMEEFLEHLRRREIPYRLSNVPGTRITQVNIHDPDGNHIHVDFTSESH